MKKKLTVNAPVSVKDVILDLGNSLWKGMLQGLPKSAITIPHAIKMMDAAQFSGVMARQRGGLRVNESLDSSQFEYHNAYYMVGENAESIGADTRRSGAAKYTRDYYGAAAVAMLLRLLPEGHDHIRVMAMFPPGDVRSRDDLISALGGLHTVRRSDGEVVKFRVRQVHVMDEPVGGIRHYLFAHDGKHYRMDVPDGQGLCIDIGGKISTLVRFRPDGWVDYAYAQSVDIGIQDVMAEVSRMVLANAAFKDYFRGVRGALPFDQDMRNALTSGIYPAGGYELPVLEIIADATQRIRQMIGDVYMQLGGARPYRFIMVTGGGGGLLYTQLVEHVLQFNPDRVYLPGDTMNAHLWNLYGASKTVAMMHHKGVMKG